MIKADSKNRVFVTDQMYSPDETHNALYAGNPACEGKGSHVVVMRVPEGVERLSSTQPNEIVLRGSLRPEIIHSGPNPF